MKQFTDQDIERALDAKVEFLKPEDLARIAQHPEAVEGLVSELGASDERAGVLAKLLFDFVQAHAQKGDPSPFRAAAQAAGALLYLSAPTDLVPDYEEQGYADDAAIVELAVRRARTELDAFCLRSGREAPFVFDERARRGV